MICCTDYGVICVYVGVLWGYLVDIAVLFCSYWSKMEYMSILSVQLWQGVLSSMLSLQRVMAVFDDIWNNIWEKWLYLHYEKLRFFLMFL